MLVAIASSQAVGSRNPTGGHVLAFDDDSDDEIAAAGRPAILKIDRIGCLECAKLDEFWDMAGSQLPPSTVWRLSCSAKAALCAALVGTGLPPEPHIRAWTGGGWEEYAGNKDLESLGNWMMQMIALSPEHAPRREAVRAPDALLAKQIEHMASLFREEPVEAPASVQQASAK